MIVFILLFQGRGLPRYRPYYQHRAHRGVVIARGRRTGHHRSRVVDGSRLQHARNRSRALTCSPSLSQSHRRGRRSIIARKISFAVFRIIFQSRTINCRSLVISLPRNILVLHYQYNQGGFAPIYFLDVSDQTRGKFYIL